ncbi:serine protease [Herbihabitans rhizosphaerae]|uniref:Serine protease n=1 Tax=Herbihabitans rhizosphaerae TaxID=1872711 RepID=A0A4Q7KRX3_9PSEU|nr:S8 family peptidase [Herbihabitans rhizosphaerae]RZS39294.1 serine protease [Herbihabitans rhizosphaerae]
MKRKVLVAALSAAAVAGGVLSVAIPASADPAEAAAPAKGARLIVGYKAATPKSADDNVASADVSTRSTDTGAKFSRRTGTGAVVVDLGTSDPAKVDASIKRFQADPDVEYVEVDRRVHRQALAPAQKPGEKPNDTEYGRQWDLYEEKAGMNVPGAWASTTGKDVVVAVIDTGYVKHSELESKIVPGYDFISDKEVGVDGDGRDADPSDPGDWYADGECGEEKGGDSSWHGTHVAGTIAAATNNKAGIAGIAYDAKIQPIRVLGKCGGSGADIADAITWASGGKVGNVPANKTPAKVINLSLGGAGRCDNTTQRAINGAVQRGTTVVVAAGNSNSDVANFHPANCGNVVSVAASSRAGDRAFYSNFGKLIDLAAPGGENRKATDPPGTITTPENGIWSTLNDGDKTPGKENYEPYMGTSMAAPHIAGLAALMYGKKADITPAQVEEALKKNVRPLPGQCEGGCGAGLADATKTVGAVK